MIFRQFGMERIWMTLVFSLTVCYTGLRTKASDPYAQITIAVDEPR